MRPEQKTDQAAITLVIHELRERGWVATEQPHHNKGYDILAEKGGRRCKIEVKARSIGTNAGHRSADPVLRAAQQQDTYRVHKLSPTQAELADAIVCVWIPLPGERIHYLVLPRLAWPLFATRAGTTRTSGPLALGIDHAVALGIKQTARSRPRAVYQPFLDEAGWDCL